MVNIYNVPVGELIENTAQELKKIEEIKPAEWAGFVKTGAHKERPPVGDDWWYVRAASILRNVYRFGPIGVSKLRTKYGGKKNRGIKPERFYKASGNIIRKIMQQLAKAGLVTESKKGVRKGKIITPKGISLLSKSGQGMANKEIKGGIDKKIEKMVETARKTRDSTESKIPGKAPSAEEPVKETKSVKEKKPAGWANKAEKGKTPSAHGPAAKEK